MRAGESRYSESLMTDKSSPSLCATVRSALEVLRNPWTGHVLAVLQGGPLRFSELSARIPQIGDKTLSARLKELEASGFLERDVEPGPPVRVSYRVTPKGAGFRGVLDAIELWGRQMRELEAPPPAPARPAPRAPRKSSIPGGLP